GLQMPGMVRVTATVNELVIARRGPDRRRPAQPPEEHAAGVPLPVPGQVDVPGTPWRVSAQLLDASDSPSPGAERAIDAAAGALPAAMRAYLDADAAGEPLVVTTWQPGDRFMPLGMTREKKLQDYFVDAKVPRDERAAVPVVWGPGHIVWVAGQRIDDRARVRPQTRRVLALRLTRRDVMA
ncbi:MAG TPA: tRNA lysidine(34) synthetase TilS, partial [Ktedonobacterales bacterium]|nr:tRNA lysidine(34) synthetase TilS [Ktedonobacterales bacterium]